MPAAIPRGARCPQRSWERTTHRSRTGMGGRTIPSPPVRRQVHRAPPTSGGSTNGPRTRIRSAWTDGRRSPGADSDAGGRRDPPGAPRHRPSPRAGPRPPPPPTVGRHSGTGRSPCTCSTWSSPMAPGPGRWWCSSTVGRGSRETAPGSPRPSGACRRTASPWPRSTSGPPPTPRHTPDRCRIWRRQSRGWRPMPETCAWTPPGSWWVAIPRGATPP